MSYSSYTSFVPAPAPSPLVVVVIYLKTLVLETLAKNWSKKMRGLEREAHGRRAFTMMAAGHLMKPVRYRAGHRERRTRAQTG